MVTATLREMLISAEAIRFGDFTLASGKKSTVYIDIKKAITSPAILKKIAAEVLTHSTDFDASQVLPSAGSPLRCQSPLPLINRM